MDCSSARGNAGCIPRRRVGSECFGRYGLYANLRHRGDNGKGLNFPEMEEPGLVEFTYFAFGVDTAFQSSDVVITKTHMRMLVTIHSIASFLYSTVLLAFVVAMVAGG